jgi:CubicO group peptidase (beta-lactamase class C family)
MPPLSVLPLAVVAAACVPANTPQPPPPATTASSPLGRAADSLLTRYAMYGMSGSVLLEESGIRVLEKGYGFANRERGIAATPATRYDIGSIAKTFTAAAILKLVERGALHLADSLGGLFTNVLPDKAGVTLHQLLTHTSGLPLDPTDAGIAATDTREVYVEKALRLPTPASRIGSYSYSNLGYGLLAIIVENSSGESFRTFVDRTFIVPLGLQSTIWWQDSVALATPGTATGYVFSDRENTLVEEPPFRRGGPTSPMWSKWPLGAGGMVSTVGDIGLWWHALQDGRALRRSLADTMFSRKDTAGNQGYSWTVMSVPALGLRIHKGGSRTGFNSLVTSYPDRKALVVYALNQSVESQWHTLVWRSLEQLLRGERDSLPPPTVTLAAEQLRRFDGVYRLPSGGEIRVVSEDGALLVGAENQAGVDALLHVATPNAEHFADWSVSVVRAALGGETLSSVPVTAEQLKDLKSWLESRVSDGTGARLQLLGSMPHPSSPRRVQTFVRLGGATGVVVRLIWEPHRLLAWADGIRFPGFRRFHPTSRTSAASFSPREPGWALLEVTERGLVVQSTAGQRSQPAIRVSP